MELNQRVKVDWDKWQEENHERDLKEDFDPEKLIELMKRNGEWSDDEGVDTPDQEPESSDSDDQKTDRPGDEQMFEQFLKSGDYLVGKKRFRPNEEGLNPEEADALDFDGLVFGKRPNFDNKEMDDLIKFI